MKSHNNALWLIVIALLLIGCSRKEGNGVTEPSTSQSRALGLDLLTPDEYAQLPTAPPPVSGALPTSFDMSEYAPPPGDQGMQPSCTAWAVAYGLKSIQESIEQGWSPLDADHQFSPAYIYNQMVQGNCNGTNIADALDLLKDQGCASLMSMPYSASDCSIMPTEQAEREAQPFTIDNWSKLRSIDDESVKAQLAGGFPVILAIRIDSSFYALTESNSVWSGFSGDFQGYHAVLALGYDDDMQAIKVLNSYGQDFAENGYFWLSYDFVSVAAEEAYVAYDHIGPPDAPRVVLYEHPSYDGDLRVIREDIPDLDLGTIDFADVCSSVLIYGLQGVRLYDGRNYTGAELTLTEDASDLTLCTFNDRIGSVDVYPYNYPQEKSVTLFEHPNYQGDSRVIRVDTPDLDLGTINFADVASSIQFNGLQGVRIYDGHNYTGSEFTLTGDIPDLTHYNFNDRIGSLDVYPYINQDPYALLFEHPNYRGDTRAIRSDIPNLDLGSINFADVASSVTLHGLHGIRLYDGANYTGAEITLTGNTSDLTSHNFNDRTGSVDVYPYRQQLDSYVILYQHPNYQGDSRVIRADTPDLDLGTINFADVASSIRIHDLPGVRLFDGHYYTGATLSVTGDIPDLTPYSFNDRTGSVDLHPYR